MTPEGAEFDVAALFAASDGFARTLGPTVVSATADEAVLRLDASPTLHNHLGGPHAAALFGLGELAAFALLLRRFGDLVHAGGVPFIKSASVEFLALVTGPVVATAVLVDDADAVRARFADRGSASFDVDVSLVREDDGVLATRVRPRMTVKRL